jgi:hypothetical protein
MNLEIDLTVPPSAQLVQNGVLTAEENRVAAFQPIDGRIGRCPSAAFSRQPYYAWSAVA